MCILIYSNFRSIIFFSSKKFATNQHEEEKKSQRQPKCLQHFWRGVQLHFSFFSKEEVFLRWNDEWSQRNDEWQEHLEKPHCCKEEDNIFVQSFYLCFWCFCVQFNLAKLFELKPTTIIFFNTKFDVSEARTWKGMGFRSQKCNKCIGSNLHIWKHKITWGIAL